jgi:hypothetical protein
MDIAFPANRSSVSQHPGHRFNSGNHIFFGGRFSVHLAQHALWSVQDVLEIRPRVPCCAPPFPFLATLLRVAAPRCEEFSTHGLVFVLVGCTGNSSNTIPSAPTGSSSNPQTAEKKSTGGSLGSERRLTVGHTSIEIDDREYRMYATRCQPKTRTRIQKH